LKFTNVLSVKYKTSPQWRVDGKTKTFKNVQDSVTDTEDPGRPSISIGDDKQVQTNATNFDDKTKIVTSLRVLVSIETTQKSNSTVLVQKINHKESITAD
jgi:hypothetical protein